jgi:hypothetical protein
MIRHKMDICFCSEVKKNIESSCVYVSEMIIFSIRIILIDLLNKTAEFIQQLEGFKNEPEIILLVHEAPNNLCSERIPLQELFKNNGIDVIEWPG